LLLVTVGLDLSILYRNLLYYRMSSSISIMFCFGFVTGTYLFFQICSGLILCCWYDTTLSHSFDSIQFASRNVSTLWLVRYLHMNVVSMVFLVLYIHGFKSVVTFTSKLAALISGVVIVGLLFMSSFIGYSLVLSQMSYWAVIVITNLVTVVPMFGFDVLYLLWGDCGVTTVLVYRFLILHFITPLILLVVIVVHLYLVHSSLTLEWLVLASHRIEISSFSPYHISKE